MKPKIIIIVEGGLVEAVYSSNIADYLIVDHDSQEDRPSNIDGCSLFYGDAMPLHTMDNENKNILQEWIKRNE